MSTDPTSNFQDLPDYLSGLMEADELEVTGVSSPQVNPSDIVDTVLGDPRLLDLIRERTSKSAAMMASKIVDFVFTAIQDITDLKGSEALNPFSIMRFTARAAEKDDPNSPLAAALKK